MARRTRSYPSGRFPDPLATRLRDALAAAHRDEPFSALDVRATANRVVAVGRRLALAPEVVRGRVDVGGAELDHVFVVVDDRVVDVALPLAAEGFTALVRAYVAGDLEAAELAAAAAAHDLDARVLGDYAEPLAYRGAPFWSAA